MTGATAAVVVSSVLLAFGSLSGCCPDPIPTGPMSLREAEAAYAGKRTQLAILNAQVTATYGMIVRDETCPLETHCDHIRALVPGRNDEGNEGIALARKVLAGGAITRPAPLYATLLVKLHYGLPPRSPGNPRPSPRLGWVELVKVIETRPTPSTEASPKP